MVTRGCGECGGGGLSIILIISDVPLFITSSLNLIVTRGYDYCGLGRFKNHLKWLISIKIINKTKNISGAVQISIRLCFIIKIMLYNIEYLHYKFWLLIG